MTRTLYHFTKPESWEQILATGVLEPRWTQDGSAPKTVHMTESKDPENLPWAFREGRTIRLELVVPEAEAHRWFDWGKTRVPSDAHLSLGIPVWTPDDPSYVNDQNLGSEHWYVVERAVPGVEWVSVVDIETGTVLWPASTQ